MEKVRVYYNLHRQTFSIQRFVKGKGWRVWTHANHIVIANPSFIVNQRGRNRVIETKRKNVHAYVQGYWVTRPIQALPGDLSKDGYTVTYNPYKFQSFVRSYDYQPVKTATMAVLDNTQNKPTIKAI